MALTGTARENLLGVGRMALVNALARNWWLLLLQPAAGAVAVVWWIGAFAILMGIAHIGLALRLRKHAHREE